MWSLIYGQGRLDDTQPAIMAIPDILYYTFYQMELNINKLFNYETLKIIRDDIL